MIPPSFSDLGKSAKDLFEKNFGFGVVKVEHKTKTSAGLDLTTSGTHNISKEQVSANFEAKYKLSKYGITLKEKWTSANVATTDIEVEDKILTGLKNTFQVVLEPHTGKRSGVIKNVYKRTYMNMSLDMDFKSKMPALSGSLVLGCPSPQGYLAGLSCDFDSDNQVLKRLDMAVAAQQKDVTFFAKWVNRSDVEASVYQRLSDKLETGLSLGWTRATQATRYAMVTKYDLGGDSFVKGKVDNNSLIGLAYCFPAREGVKITLSSEIDGKKIDAGGHRLGLGIEFES